MSGVGPLPDGTTGYLSNVILAVPAPSFHVGDSSYCPEPNVIISLSPAPEIIAVPNQFVSRVLMLVSTTPVI